MIKQKSVGRNWSLLYRKIYGAKIKKLTERNENLYNENQKLKKKYTEIKKGSLYQKRNGKNKIDNVIGYKN